MRLKIALVKRATKQLLHATIATLALFLLKMDISSITNPSIRAAFDALQAGDKTAWFAQFTVDAELIDDGQSLDFKTFFEKAIGNEKFVSIDDIAQNGTEIIGTIETEQWGSFKAYFRFHLNAEGKLNKLEIGNAANRRS